MVDTTLGVGVEYVLLHLFTGLLEILLGEEGAADFHSGSYDYDPATGSFHKTNYAKQLVVWLLVVTGMKLTMLLLMIVAALPLQTVAHAVLAPCMQSDELKLLVVMIMTPFIMNSFQFWVVDNIIKKHDDEEEEGQRSETEEELQSVDSTCHL